MTTAENLQTLCRPCNNQKSNRLIVDYRLGTAAAFLTPELYQQWYDAQPRDVRLSNHWRTWSDKPMEEKRDPRIDPRPGDRIRMRINGKPPEWVTVDDINSGTFCDDILWVISDSGKDYGFPIADWAAVCADGGAELEAGEDQVDAFTYSVRLLSMAEDFAGRMKEMDPELSAAFDALERRTGKYKPSKRRFW